jgi:hypothetical protein
MQQAQTAINTRGVDRLKTIGLSLPCVGKIQRRAWTPDIKADTHRLRGFFVSGV